jgi:hypothetical protein
MSVLTYIDIPLYSPPDTANLVLQDTIERIFSRNRYFDVPRGLYLVRGENVVMLGEIVSYEKSIFNSLDLTPALYPLCRFFLLLAT